ncbi:MAG: AAA family ATPase [Acidiferrobacterales bacterium]
MQCPQCSFQNRDEAKFCAECGVKLAIICPTCQAELRLGVKFCDECGASLTATPSSKTAHVADAQQESEPTQAERRQLTVMFCDLAGSTALSGQMDPEEFREVILAYQGACTDAIKRFCGFIARYLGDGMLVYFGYPQAHEDDAERAVRAGLGIVKSVEKLGGDFGQRKDIELAVRVGIATGPVVVGDIVGEGASQESTVLGETPNLAARLQGLAAPNSVVIAPTTQELLGGLFAYEDLGLHELKGIAGTVNAWKVAQEGTIESRFEAIRAQQLTPLVGREEELGMLRRRWERAKDGEGQVVLISGEAGIGKSRITQALRERLSHETYTVLRYQCSPYHTNSALHPIIEQLQRAAGFERDDTSEQKLDKLEALLAQSAEDVPRVTPLFATLLSIASEGRYAPLNLTPEQQKDQTLAALGKHFYELAARQPVLFVFDDAHWIDPTTHEWLDLIMAQVQDKCVLVILMFRPEFQPIWTGEAHVTSLALNKLSRKQSQAMVERVTGGKALPTEVHGQIIDKTDGVPLFVEELTKTILESGLLTEKETEYTLDGPLPPLAIPTTLQDSLMARLDRLGSVKDIAQTGSVIGREFSHALITAVIDVSEDELDRSLNKLIDSGLIFRRGTPPNANYVFKHALIQDTAYASLLRSKRRELHGRIAEALEDGFAETVKMEPELLAHHYSEAGRGEPAIEYWLQAGRRAMERSGDQEAVGHLSKGLADLATLPRSTERDRKELDFQLTLTSSLTTTHGWGSEETVKANARARELCELLGETEALLKVLEQESVKHWAEAEFRAAIEIGNQAIRLAQQRDDRVATMCGHLLLGWPYICLGKLKAVESAVAEVMNYYDPEEHSSFRFRYGLDFQVEALGMRGYQQWFCGFPDQAVQSGIDSIAYARELNHAGSLAWALTWAGAQPAALRHDASRAEALANELIALPKEQRSPVDLAWGRVCTGWAIGKRGRREAGVSLLRQGLESLTTESVKMGRSMHLALLVELYIDGGELGKASQALDQARRHMEQTEERIWAAEIHRLAGEICLARDPTTTEQAKTFFRQAIAVSQSLGAMSLELRTTLSLARLLRNEGQGAEARSMLEAIYGQFTEGFDTPDLKDAKTLLAELE